MADLICRKTMMRCQTQGMCSPHGGCQHSHSAAPRQPACVDGPDYGDGPEFEGWAERSGSEAAKLLLPALRQYMHNDGSGLLAGYDLETTQAIIDGLRAENETLRKRAKTAEREAESALKTYKGLEKVARVVSDNSDQVCGELNVTRQQRDQLAGLLQMIASRGLSPVLTEHELEQIDASLAGLEAPGPAPAVKLCVACRTLHPLDHFDKAAPDFPTRDGLNCNCRKSAAEKGYRLMRLPNGKVEPRP